MKQCLLYPLYALIAVLFWLPVFSSPNNLAERDWDQHFLYYQSVFRSVYEFVQMPFWNPWYCGGNVLWQNPQVALFSPVYLLAPFMSLALAMKITIVLHYLLSFVGMHLLLTHCFGLRSPALIIFLGSVYTLSGAHVFHIDAGHTTFFPFLYLPLITYFLYSSLFTGRVRSLIYAALVAAAMLVNGGFYAFAMAMVTLGLLLLLLAAVHRSRLPVLAAALFFSLTGLFAGPKLLPVLKFMGSPQFVDTRQHVDIADSSQNATMIEALLNPHQTRGMKFNGETHGWHERGDYIGTAALGMIAAATVAAIVAAACGGDATGLPLALMTVLTYILARGDFSPYAPYTFLRTLPVLKGLRVPPRYIILIPFFGSLAVAWVASRWPKSDSWPRPAKWFISTALLLFTFDLAYRNQAILDADAFSLAPLTTAVTFNAAATRPTPPLRFDDVSLTSGGHNSPMLRASSEENRSLLRCYEPVQVQRTCDPSKPLVFTNGQAEVSNIVFTPSRIEFTVQAVKDSAAVYLNQNYMTGWTSSRGSFAQDSTTKAGAIALAPGESGTIVLSYFPEWLWAGVGALLVGVGLSALLWRRRFRPLLSLQPGHEVSVL